MNVKELIQQLNKYPDEAIIFVDSSGEGAPNYVEARSIGLIKTSEGCRALISWYCHDEET